VFLDEIGDMPIALQSKLLRALQEREVRPVGSSQSVPVDVRIISATHRNLEERVSTGEFREDLYYRLNVVSLAIPPLSQRPEDIVPLARHFLATTAARYGKDVRAFAPEAMEMLLGAPWPGNVRQLSNVVEQAVALRPPRSFGGVGGRGAREAVGLTPADGPRARRAPDPILRIWRGATRARAALAPSSMLPDGTSSRCRCSRARKRSGAPRAEPTVACRRCQTVAPRRAGSGTRRAALRTNHPGTDTHARTLLKCASSIFFRFSSLPVPALRNRCAPAPSVPKRWPTRSTSPAFRPCSGVLDGLRRRAERRLGPTEG
jgi:hypothetical protein